MRLRKPKVHTVEKEDKYSKSEYSKLVNKGEGDEKESYKTEDKKKLRKEDGFGDVEKVHKEKACTCIPGAGCVCDSPDPKIKYKILDDNPEFAQEGNNRNVEVIRRN